VATEVATPFSYFFFLLQNFKRHQKMMMMMMMGEVGKRFFNLMEDINQGLYQGQSMIRPKKNSSPPFQSYLGW